MQKAKNLDFWGFKMEWRWQLKTDQNGIELWPNASTWMRVESRSRSWPCSN